MLTDEGDTVIDPFAGSCVTGEVSERLGASLALHRARARVFTGGSRPFLLKRAGAGIGLYRRSGTDFLTPVYCGIRPSPLPLRATAEESIGYDGRNRLECAGRSELFSIDCSSLSNSRRSPALYD